MERERGGEQDAWAWAWAWTGAFGGGQLWVLLWWVHIQDWRCEPRGTLDGVKCGKRKAAGCIHGRRRVGRWLVVDGARVRAQTSTGRGLVVVVDGVGGGWLMVVVVGVRGAVAVAVGGTMQEGGGGGGGGRRKKFEERQMGRRAGRGQGSWPMAHGPRAGYRAFLRPDPPGRRAASLRPQWAPPSPGPPRRPDPDPPGTRCRDTAPATARVRPRFCTWRVRAAEGCPHELEAAKLGPV